MSLDIYLRSDPEVHECQCPNCGTVHSASKSSLIIEFNITHNLSLMAKKSYLYTTIWHPEELFPTPRALNVYPILVSGLDFLLVSKDSLSKYSDPSGWGTYDQFVKFVREYIAACKEYPTALIETSS
jgi:hypothetical protein